MVGARRPPRRYFCENSQPARGGGAPMIGLIISIARYTFVQQFRNRLYLVILFFGALLVLASLLFGAVAGDEEVRIILALGLAVIELLGLVTAIFGSVTLILEEMESRTIYLILT